MIFKKALVPLFFIFFLNYDSSIAEEKFEGIIASVDSEAITTYDLSERIKLVLKSLKLDDNIKNRDSVRDRVLELLIIEKLKKIEAKKADISADENEVKELASVIYSFPVKEFEDFKKFLASETIDSEIVLEQLKNELLWKKLSQQMFASKITINSADIDAIINNYKNKIGKTEYNYSEIVFLNDTTNDSEVSKKKMDTVLSLLDSGTSFELLASKFSDTNPQGNKSSWIIEDNLDDVTKNILKDMGLGEIKTNIKINNGLKILKLNKKRKFGNEGAKYSFLKFSSFNKKNIEQLTKSDINCNSVSVENFNNEIKFLKIQDMVAKDISETFLSKIELTKENTFTDIFDLDGEYNLLYLCKKNESDINHISRETIERRAFSKKFNQLTNTYLSNIRKSTNIKFFNK